MISLVLYGRNDNYGYNLHKRAAISFNCMAELLTDRDDEILFVDYNTPDDMPTFVEAILDTLTDKARRVLRVLRVRPSLHQLWRDKTHLMALEPISRNIAIRRSNPNNKWILSTNTDMVFVMRDKFRSLGDAARDLPRGYYGIPRYEMPESLWESLDRKEPRRIIDSFADWGQRLHLDEVVHSHKSILYDAPGDFQLVPRKDMFAIHGFSEAMLRGWHVDSNLAKRCLLLYGETKSLFHRVYGYHCDHTKVATPMHGADRQQNDMVEHITNVRAPQIPEQAETWGAPDAEIEELRFPPGTSLGFADAIAPLLGPMPKPFYEANYTEKSWNQVTYPARHALPYLADHLVTLPRDIDLGYAGLNDTMRALLAEAWRALGFTGRLLVLDQTAGEKPGCEAPPASDAPYVVADLDYLVEHAGLFILDFGVEHGPGWPNPIFDLKRNPKAPPLLPFVKATQAAGFAIAAAERRRMADRQAPRRIIFLNTIGTELLGQLDTIVGQIVTPFCTHARHGTVRPDPMAGLEQRRAEAARMEAGIVKDLMKTAENWLPVDLLDKVAPHALLNDEHRAVVAAQAAKSDPIQPWHPMALLSLSTLTGDFPRRLEAFFTLDRAEPQAFLKRLTMLRIAASEAMSRPWPPEIDEILARTADRFLADCAGLPDEVRLHGVGGYLGLCQGAAGAGLQALAERLIGHAEIVADNLTPRSVEMDAWLALHVAEFAVARGKDVSRLVMPAMARLSAQGRPAAPPAARVALVAGAPFARAIDPAAAALSDAIAGLLASGLAATAIQVFPEVAPDPAFLTACKARGVAVAKAPDSGTLGAPGLAQRTAAVLQAIRAWSASDVLAIGNGALALGVLAQGAAPRQAILANRMTPPGAPGVDDLLTPADLGGWVQRIAQKSGDSVHVAAE